MESVSRIKTLFKRELKSYFDSPIAYVFLVVFLMLTGFLTFSVSRLFEKGEADPGSFFFWHPWVYLIFVPAVSMRLWAEERRTGTLELLLTLPFTLTQAIIGKFLAAWAFLGIALLLTLTLPVSMLMLGGHPDAGVFLSGYLGSFALAGTFLAIGMWTSSLSRNQVVSFVLAVVISIFLLLAGWPPVTDILVRFAPPAVVRVISAFSYMPHYDSCLRGVLDLRDFAYFASVMVLMLVATHVVLENRKSA
jgi:ABC-2 type transport system permease protein